MKVKILSLICLMAISVSAEATNVFVKEDDSKLRAVIEARLGSRIHGKVVDDVHDADWIVDKPGNRTLKARLGDEGFAIKSAAGKVHVYGNRRRSRLYGLWELIELQRRGSITNSLDVVEVPDSAIRGDTQCPHTPYKLSRDETLAFWRKWFDWAIWMRTNIIMPFQSNGRVIVPQGYPDYNDLEYGVGGGYYAMKHIYDLCQVYDIDFYYPLHLYPVPAETGYRDEPSTSNDFFYPDGVEDRVPGIGIKANPYATQYQNKFPEYFTDDSRVDLSFHGVWNAIATEITAAQELFPNLKGILLNFAETNGHTQRYRFLRHQIPTQDVMKKTFGLVRKLAEGKQIVIFHHGSELLPDRYSDVEWNNDTLGFLKDHTSDIIHIVDLHAGPQFPGQPLWGGAIFSDVFKQLCSEVPVVLWTICDGEHVGRNAFAYSVPEYIFNDMKEAIGHGVKGSFQRTANYDFGIVPGTVLEVNAYAAYRLLWDADIPLEQIWDEWTSSRFGPDVAVPVKQALMPVETIVRKGLMLQNCPMFGLVGFQNAEYYVAGLLRCSFAGIRYPTSLDLFQPAGTLMEDVVTTNRRDWYFLKSTHQVARPYTEIRNDRKEAVALAKKSVRQIESLKNALAPADYTHLIEMLENLQYMAEISAVFTEALYYEKMAFVDNYDDVEDPIGKYETALDNFERRLFEIQHERGQYFFYGLPQAMITYRQIGRLRLEAAVASHEFEMR